MDFKALGRGSCNLPERRSGRRPPVGASDIADRSSGRAERIGTRSRSLTRLARATTRKSLSPCLSCASVPASVSRQRHPLPRQPRPSRASTAFRSRVFDSRSPTIAAEPTPTKADCIASSESAQDLLHAGKLLDARAQFGVCVSASCPGPIREDCSQHLEEIAKAIPSIIFEVKDSAGHCTARTYISLITTAATAARSEELA